MDTIGIVLISLLALVTLVAALIFIRGLFPLRVEKVMVCLEEQWKRSFWLGLVNTVFISIFVFGLGSLAENAPILFLPTFAVYGFFLIGLLFGLTAFIQILGIRLFPDTLPIKRDIKSGTILLLTGLLPFVGWFLLFPYVICLAVGAVVLALFQNKKTKTEEPSK